MQHENPNLIPATSSDPADLPSLVANSKGKVDEQAPQLKPRSRLLELETVIERGIQTFVDVGMSLIEIRDAELYRETGSRTFEEYCKKRFWMARPTAYKYIDAAQVAKNVYTCRQTGPGPSVSQARELAPLSPEQQRTVASQVDFGTATVAEVRSAAQQIRAERKPSVIRHGPRTAMARLEQMMDDLSCVAKILPRIDLDLARTHPDYSKSIKRYIKITHLAKTNITTFLEKVQQQQQQPTDSDPAREIPDRSAPTVLKEPHLLR